MSRYGTIGLDLGRIGRWTRFGYGLLIGGGAAASTIIGLDDDGDPVTLLPTAAALLVAISLAYLGIYWLFGERLFARADPWLNTLILVGPALTIAYWNITLGNALGVDLPTSLTLAMLAYIGASFVLQAIIGYGGCEVVAIPIMVFKRRYVTYCVPIVLLDAAERGWLESDGLRRGLWIALGAASFVTITLGILQIAPAALSGLTFLVVAALVAALTYLERREAISADGDRTSPSVSKDMT